MLDTMPYADLLAIYNTIAEKPVTRFDTRANGVRRTEALLEARGLTLPEAARMAEDEHLQIPREMTYSLPGLSREMVEKLTFVRPVSLGQAGRIPGVTPAAIAILRMHLRRGIRVAAAS